MSITVADCLKLPSLRNCRVAAGHRGLDHIVHNVSVLEIYDETLFNLEAPITDSDITLTSFAYIKDNYELQCRHIEKMYNLGDAAVIIFYVGIYLPEIHPSLIETADRLGFPLLVMPENEMGCFYREVIYDIYDAIFREQRQEKNLIHNITTLAARLPENKKNLTTLLQLISDSLKCTVLLSDAGMNNVAISKYPVTNSLTAGEICSLYESAAAEDEDYAETSYCGQPIYIFHRPFTVFEYRNFSLYMADEFGTLTINDVYNVIELLQIFSKLWNLDSTNILENSLIASILDGDADRMHQIAEKLSIDIGAVNTVFFLRPVFSSLEAKEKIQLQRRMLKTISSASEYFRGPLLLDIYGPYIVGFIIYSSSEKDDEELLNDMLLSLNEIWKDYTISFFPCEKSAADVQQTYTLYSEHIADAVTIFPNKKLFSYGDLLFAERINKLCHGSSEDFRVYKNILAPLFSENDGDQLLETLAAYYLDAGCEVKETAGLLFIHRNTIQYRLNKICSITNFQTGDPMAASLLQQAVACYRLCPEAFSQ